jgi:hypothetical protein
MSVGRRKCESAWRATEGGVKIGEKDEDLRGS